MEKPSNSEVLGVSSGWVAVILNLFPGLGTGYIYQRRWRAYWITLFATFLLLSLGAYLQLRVDPSDPGPSKLDQFSFYSLIMISLATSAEAGYAVRKVRF